MGVISVAFPISKERVVLTGHGDLAASDIIEAAAQVYADPRFQPGMDSLLDMRGARTTVSADEVRMMVETVSRNIEVRGKGRCAVVTSREVDYGMARIALVHMELIGIELTVFRELAEAERWLDWDRASEVHAPSLETDHEQLHGGD